MVFLGRSLSILAILDTSRWLSSLKSSIGYSKTLGVNVHSCLVVTGDGLVLGVLDWSGYNRPEAKDESASHDRKKTRPIEEDEAFLIRIAQNRW
jgi:hypothetical protein